MSLTVPTPQEYRAALDRLAAEHARRVMVERELGRLTRDKSVDTPVDLGTTSGLAKVILMTLPEEDPVEQAKRREYLKAVGR